MVQLLFGTWPIFGKIVLRSISSTSLVGFRICGAAIIFALVQRKLAALRHLPRRVLAWLVLTSLLGVVLNQLLFVKGLSLTTAINATLLSTTIPVFTLVVSIALGHDRASVETSPESCWLQPGSFIWWIRSEQVFRLKTPGGTS